jgi:flagellar hook-associated protein 2
MASSPVAISGLGQGLAGQIDSQALITKLVQIEQQPLTDLQTQETAVKSQVSALGTLASRLASFQSAAQALSSDGALGVTTTSTNTDFTATAGSASVAGSYDVEVDTLAKAAKWRSAGFNTATTLQAGDYKISADGTDYTVHVDQDASLSDLVANIRASGAPVSAAILNDGTNNYLSITATNTGFDPTQGAGSALAISFTPSVPGEQGVDVTVGATQTAAVNASFQIDGLAFTRRSNVVTDALPGTTLNLTHQSGVPETLNLSNDTDATEKKVQTFVDAYNSVMQFIQSQLDISSTTDRSSTLAGDATVRGLQQAMQSLTSSIVSGLGGVRSLADLGIKTAEDGTLSIDTDVLSSAISRDAGAVNAIFSNPNDGISKLASDLVDTYTLPSSGLLSVRIGGLNDQIQDMDDQATRMQAQIQAYQDSLTQQFVAMESLVSGLSSIGDFLTQQANANAAAAKQ